MRNLLIFSALAAVLLVLAWTRIWSGPYYYDESDYVFAARQGFWANYTDSPAMPIGDFVRAGLGRGKSAGGAAELSEAIRKSGDVVFYRHWHGPLHVYFLTLARGALPDERLTRILSMFFPVLALAAIFFGCVWLTPGPEGVTQALLAGLFYATSGPAAAATELAPHQLFAACSALCSVLLAKAIGSHNRKYFVAAAAAAGLAFCALEVTFVLVAVLLAALAVERKALQSDWKLLVQGGSSFLLIVLVVWPGAILKLSFLKAYFFMAYLAVFRKAAWGQKSLWETWAARVAESPVEWALAALAVSLFFGAGIWRKKRYPWVFLLQTVLMIGATLRVNSESPRYLLTFLPGLDLFTASVLAAWAAPRGPIVRYGGALAAGFLALLVTWPRLADHSASPNPHPAAVLQCIRDNKLEFSRLLVPKEDLPMVHCYFPKADARAYLGNTPTRQEIGAAQAEGVILPGYPVRYQALSNGRE